MLLKNLLPSARMCGAAQLKIDLGSLLSSPNDQVLMKPELRHVSRMPLDELWNDRGVVAAKKVQELGAPEIVSLLRAGKVRFVVADIGHHLLWIPLDVCYEFWKSEVKLHLAQPEAEIYLEDFPGEYCYLASEWKADTGEPIVLLMKSH